jgi:hypothetical protein
MMEAVRTFGKSIYFHAIPGRCHFVIQSCSEVQAWDKREDERKVNKGTNEHLPQYETNTDVFK